MNIIEGTIPCDIDELNLNITLACGQSFRWKTIKAGEWTGVLYGSVWTLRQDDKNIYFKVRDRPTSVKENEFKPMEQFTIYDSVHTKSKEKSVISAQVCKTEDHYSSILHDYFQLEVKTVDLYKQWCSVDKNFFEKSSSFKGVRMLRQDPIENLFSFICSSNNHISRISGMVERMCEVFGEILLVLDGISYYSFPKLEVLAGKNVENKLRDLGFGYRARYINETAKFIMKNHSADWLYSLREIPYKEAKSQLMKLCGVGSKVADCVCLMSLDKVGAIPVDTHVWQIAKRDYMPKLKDAKTLTDSLYWEIGDHFRSLWGEYAGWAHSVLFSADLKKFKQEKTESGKNNKRDRSTEIENGSSRPKKREEAYKKV